MEKKLQTFLNSGLIERYALGETTNLEELQVESFIAKYPEAQLEFEKTQQSLEILCKANAVEAPQFILDKVLAEIDYEEQGVIQLNSMRHRTPWYGIAASIVALLFAGASFLLYQQNQALLHENNVVVDEIFDLRSDINQNNARLDDVMKQFLKLNNPDTEKYVFKGKNDRAKNIKTVAYINAVEKTSMIDVVSLPQLPKEQYYQMWAELQDRMVNLGILDATSKDLQSIPYMEDALGLSITIENKEGTNQALAENSVAEIKLKNN